MKEVERRGSSSRRNERSLLSEVEPTVKVGEASSEIFNLAGWKGKEEYEPILPVTGKSEVLKIDPLSFGGKEKVHSVALEKHDERGELVEAIVSGAKHIRALQAASRDCRDQIEKFRKDVDCLIEAGLGRRGLQYPSGQIESGEVYIVRAVDGAKLAEWKLGESIPPAAVVALAGGLATGGIALVIDVKGTAIRIDIGY